MAGLVEGESENDVEAVLLELDFDTDGCLDCTRGVLDRDLLCFVLNLGDLDTDFDLDLGDLDLDLGDLDLERGDLCLLLPVRLVSLGDLDLDLDLE